MRRLVTSGVREQDPFRRRINESNATRGHVDSLDIVTTTSQGDTEAEHIGRSSSAFL